MKIEGLATKWYWTLVLAALMAAAPSRALAQALHSHAEPIQELLQDQKSRGGALVRSVRDATERFKDVNVAEAEDYHLQFGCVSGPDAGAMGMAVSPSSARARGASFRGRRYDGPHC